MGSGSPLPPTRGKARVYSRFLWREGRRFASSRRIATNPVWSEDGSSILYMEPQLPFARVKAVTPDAQPIPLPEINVTGPDRFRLIPGSRAIVIADRLNFVRVDLATGQKRPLTKGTYGFEIQNFDVSPDGKQIIFDRVRNNSDIVVIDLR